MKVDLHIHTNASDGELSPQGLVNKAIKEHMDIIAITDHDTVDALMKLEEQKIENPVIIHGIELSAMKKCSIHILGYFVDIHDKEFLQEIEKIKVSRMKEIKQVVGKLKKNVNDNICMKDIILHEKKLTMDAIADYLWKQGYSGSRADSYDKYLKEGKCAFVQKECLEPQKAIEIIVKAGGIPVLAHPNRLKLNSDEKKELIDQLVQSGLRGIEIYCKDMDDIAWYRTICYKYNLIITGGSDFHRKEDKLGYWKEDELIPSDIYQELCN